MRAVFRERERETTKPKRTRREQAQRTHLTNTRSLDVVLFSAYFDALFFSQRTRTRGASAGSTRPTTRRPFNISPGGVPPTTATVASIRKSSCWNHVVASSRDESRRRPFKPEGTSCGASFRWTWTGARWNERSKASTGRRRFEVRKKEEGTPASGKIRRKKNSRIAKNRILE